MQEGLGIYTVELYLKVRLAVSEGMSRRQAAKHFNISRDGVSKMVSYSTPPGYQRQSPIRRPSWMRSFRRSSIGWMRTSRCRASSAIRPSEYSCQRRSKNRPRGGAKVGHCDAGLRPPGGLKPERGFQAGVAISREVFSLPFGRGFGRNAHAPTIRSASSENRNPTASPS